jgi:deazaflavin-dependent oxidoreductase (nitroreductase family)
VSDRYLEPDWMTTHVLNRLVGWLTRRGLSIRGSRVLAVRGRTTNEWRTTPVNPLALDGARYLVAPRGTTQWVRNIRASGAAELRKGRRAEAIRVAELSDEEKVPVLRAYLAHWKFETGKFFGGTGPDASDDELRAIAPNHPAFRISD